MAEKDRGLLLKRWLRDAALGRFGWDPFRRRQTWETVDPEAYHGQCGQDAVLHQHVFGDREHGVYVDVGAHDGVKFSNTLFFEERLGWTGLCVEPLPEVFEQLVRNRPGSTCVQTCIANRAGEREFVRIRGYSEMLSGIKDQYDPRHMARIRSELTEYGGEEQTLYLRAERLDDLMREHRIEHIDLLCVDVEGAELEVLHSFDFAQVLPNVVCVENNYHDPRVWRFFRRRRYRPLARVGGDEVYLSPDFAPTPVDAPRKAEAGD